MPLSPQACREQNHETCEDNMADHGTHLKARPAGPFPKKAFTNKKDAPNPPLVSILFPIPYPLFPALCYNRRAVERAAKWELVQAQADPARAAPQSVAPLRASESSVVRAEDPSRYCPVCSQRLESQRCKLICSVCGYYMSCADYY